MKLAKRLIALLLACLMFGSVAAMAVQPGDIDRYDKYTVTDVFKENLYKETVQLIKRGAGYEPGKVYVVLKRDITGHNAFKYLDALDGTGKFHIEDFTDVVPELAELNLEKFGIGYAHYVTTMTLTLVDKSGEAILDAIDLLQKNPMVAYATVKGDINIDEINDTAPKEDSVAGFVLLALETVIRQDEIDEYLPELSEMDVDGTYIIDGGNYSFLLIKLVDESGAAVKNAADLLKVNPIVAHVYNDTYAGLETVQTKLTIMGNKLPVDEIFNSIPGAAVITKSPVQDYTFTEEELAKIYDPARYEAKDYLPGRLIVGLSKNIPADKTYAELFPDYTIDERYTKEYETITVCHFKLSENTQDAVIAAIGVLKNNPYVIYAEPYYVREEKQTLIGDKPVGAPEGATFTVTPERLAEIYDPANYTQREYAPGVVHVYFNRAVSGVRTYEELFPEFEIDKIEYVFNCDKFTSLTINLKEKTKQAVVEAIGILKNRADIAYAEPSYQSGFFMKDVVAGDIDQNGAIENPDLILMARYVVNLVELSAIEEYFADINGDGSVTNADIIQVARTIVGLTPFYRPMLSEQRAWELNTAMLNKYHEGIYRMEYYGKYNGCDIADIKGYGIDLAVTRYVDVAGHTFAYGEPVDAIYVFKGQDVLRIEAAYEAGWITAADVDRLCLNLQGPGPEPAKKTSGEIFGAFIKYKGSYGSIKRMNYYGVFGDCDIAVIRSDGDNTPAIQHIQVGAYDFSFANSTVGMYAFKDKVCLRLDEAYEAGWLTDEDVAAIWAMGKPYTFSTGDDLAESAAFNIL